MFDIEFLVGFVVIGGFFFGVWGFLVFFLGDELVEVDFFVFGEFLGGVCFLVIIRDIFFLVFFNMVMVCNKNVERF